MTAYIKFDDVLVADLELSVRTTSACGRLGIVTVGDMRRYGWKRFAKERNIGRRAVNEMRDAIDPDMSGFYAHQEHLKFEQWVLSNRF